MKHLLLALLFGITMFIPDIASADPGVDAYDLPGNAFGISVRKREGPAGQKNVGLDASFSVGAKTPIEGGVENAGTYWRVVFGTSPEPGDMVTLKLRFSYEVDDLKAVEEKIETASEAIEKRLLLLFEKAKANPKQEWLHQSIRGDSEALLKAVAPLQDYNTTGEKRLSDALLLTFGLLRKDGKVELKEANTLQNILIARDDANFAKNSVPKNWVMPTSGTGKCLGKVDILSEFDSALFREYSQNEVQAWEEAFKACFRETRLTNEGKTQSFSKWLDEANQATTPERTPFQRAVLAADKALNKFEVSTIKDPVRDFPQLPTKVNSDNRHNLFRLSKSHLIAQVVTKRSSKRFEEIAKKARAYVEDLTFSETARILLEGQDERRQYDVVTGMVYLFNLDDFVLPIALSICPFYCLREGENMFSSWASFARSIHLDIGTAAIKLDENVDPRHVEKQGLIVGGGINPLSFIRIAGGIYMFENKVSSKWNAVPYLGLTLDLLKAGTVFGLLGLESKAPTVEGEVNNETNGSE